MHWLATEKHLLVCYGKYHNRFIVYDHFKTNYIYVQVSELPQFSQNIIEGSLHISHDFVYPHCKKEMPVHRTVTERSSFFLSFVSSLKEADVIF